MAKANSAKSLRANEFLVTPTDRPGWVPGSERQILVGDEVYCAGGVGIVASVHGKTGDGSRLIAVRLNEGPTALFFAAASNVLVAPNLKRAASGN
jgi:hypothetical protein